MPQERLITEKDLLKVAQYISGFDIIRIERHDKAGGFRFISKHLFYNKGPKYIEQAYPEIFKDRITINDGLDPLFYAFEITPDTHRFVISAAVVKKLLGDGNENISKPAEQLLKAIKSIEVDKDSTAILDEFLTSVSQ